MIPVSRQAAVQLLIGLLLVLQAAHQAPADTGNLCRIQGQVLLLGHLNRYRDKF